MGGKPEQEATSTPGWGDLLQGRGCYVGSCKAKGDQCHHKMTARAERGKTMLASPFILSSSLLAELCQKPLSRQPEKLHRKTSQPSALPPGSSRSAPGFLSHRLGPPVLSPGRPAPPVPFQAWAPGSSYPTPLDTTRSFWNMPLWLADPSHPRS